MSLEYIGNVSVLTGLPTVAATIAQFSADISVQLPKINAQLSAGLDLQPPMLLTDLIANLLATITALQALLATGVAVIPSAINLSLTADLNVSLATLTAQLEALVALQSSFANIGVHMYAYDGADVGLGPALTAELAPGLPPGPPGQSTFALVLAASDAGAVAALKTLSGL